MATRRMVAVDGNEAVASVAHRTNEVIVIYPITPSSGMGELADEWASRGITNIWNAIPSVTEMQSEGGAIAAVHGALQSGSLATTFTASQGLLLMIPNMYKIAGEMTPFCMHVSARTLATHALSIFGDHSDVMSVRQCGFSMLASGSVQEAHDMALIGQAATLKSRIPVLHFFDGFRTSHEVAKIEEMTDSDLQAMMDEDLIEACRDRALTPDRPVLRGTAQNPDTFFQATEARNIFYTACPDITQDAMDRFAEITGRHYKLYEYVGHPEAEKVIIIMGSGAEVVHETIDYLNARGEKIGLLKVRLYRPFSISHFISALPTSVRGIAVMDRCKENGAIGEPLYMDVVTALQEAAATGQHPTMAQNPLIIGGRYGLSSKEFTPAMVKAAFDELDAKEPKRRFTVGINDDVTHLSLKADETFSVEPDTVGRSVFYGLGADGTVGANKNSIKIIAENTDSYVQGYFVYDSKKSGTVTVSHLRFSPNSIKSSYLVGHGQADFVACHQFIFIDRYDMLDYARDGATFLLNAPYGADEVWDRLPRSMQQVMIDKKIRFYTIDANKVASQIGMGRRINTVMQTCFFAISGVLPRDEAIAQIKGAIEKTYSRKGRKVVDLNFAAVDNSLINLKEVKLPDQATTSRDMPPPVPDHAPDLVKQVTGVILANKGDILPVSAFPVDGTWPTGTAQYEKRNIALEIPVWTEELCIQCNKCALVCPHAAIRVKVFDDDAVEDAPSTFKIMDYKGKEFGKGVKYSVQVAPEDCTGCEICVRVCPGKDKENPDRLALRMEPQIPLREAEAENWDFFLGLPEVDRTLLRSNVKMTQFARPLMEFSGACAGCGETPYIKLITQLYGDRMLVANATGCSSIYGANLPTTPYTFDDNGRGPAWSNSLFEDNAEFGLGFRLSIDKHKDLASVLLNGLRSKLGPDLVDSLLNAVQDDETGIAKQRERVVELRKRLSNLGGAQAHQLGVMADYLVKKSVWILGGDGWAYDIGFGGLDHVIASGENVNILVMDTEVYSNTGGQQSKATTIGASAKFAIAGKSQPKKDLGLMAMTYGNVYVASIAFGAKDAQTVKAIQDAESFDGPSLIIAYSHCILHGYNMADSLDQQSLAVAAGYWPLYRYDPRKIEIGEKPLTLDHSKVTADLADYMANEVRFQSVNQRDPEHYQRLISLAKKDIGRRMMVYQKLSEVKIPAGEEKDKKGQ